MAGAILPNQWSSAYLGDVLTHPVTSVSIVNSLKYASLSTVVDLLLGIALGYIIVRSRVRWRGALDALAMMPPRYTRPGHGVRLPGHHAARNLS
jgi:iron(III) transport system permease protein